VGMITGFLIVPTEVKQKTVYCDTFFPMPGSCVAPWGLVCTLSFYAVRVFPTALESIGN
jgi:hypothetical protein